jgi:hypothetical protein
MTNIFDIVREHLYLEEKYVGAKVNQDTLKRRKDSIASRKELGSLSAQWEDPERVRYFTKDIHKNKINELNIKGAWKALKKPGLSKSREARRLATQKKLEMRRAADKAKVKKTAATISQSNKEKASWRKTPVRVSVQPPKKITLKQKQIEYKSRR